MGVPVNLSRPDAEIPSVQMTTPPRPVLPPLLFLVMLVVSGILHLIRARMIRRAMGG